MNGCERAAGFDPAKVEITLNKWVLSECASAAVQIEAGITEIQVQRGGGRGLSLRLERVLRLVSRNSPSLSCRARTARPRTRRARRLPMSSTQICKLLHPFMPFLTEELWAVKGETGPARDETLLALATWPSLSHLRDDAAEAEIGWIVDLVSEIRSARAETNVPAGAQITLQLINPSADAAARVARWDGMLKRLARLETIDTAQAAPKASVQLLVRGEVAALPLEGVVDIAAERAAS